MAKRIKTKYEGVYYILGKRRGSKEDERIYYIYFRKNGKQFEEKAGRQYEDNMTAAKASNFRHERISGKRLSRIQIEEKNEAERIAKLNRWTFTRLWDEYKKCNPHLKGIVQDENRFKKHLQPTFGNKTPEDLNSFEVNSFRVNLLKELKPATVKNILELFRRLCRFGEKNNLCDAPNFIIQMPKVNNIITEYLSPDALKRLITAIDEDPDIQVANFMRMALFTGMRRGELFRLQWKDINFDRGFISIRNPKGGEDQEIPLNDTARNILKTHPRSDSPFVFPGKNGGQRVDIKRSVNRVKKRARLPKDFRPLHGLRHVYASMLASSGQVDLFTLQKLLTHKSPQMTQRYAHLQDEALKNASNVMGDLVEQSISSKIQMLKKVS